MSSDFQRTLPGPDNILRKQFPNGVTVLIRENPWSATAALCGSLFAGSCLEPADKTGLAPFVSASLTAGTRTRSFEQISEYMETTGTSLGFTAGPHTVKFSGHCLSEDLSDLLGLLREILDGPAFPEHYIEILRQRALAAYELHLDDPEDMADEWFDRMVWGMDHPYGRPEFGSAGVIRGFTRDDMVRYHRRFFGPEKFILTLSGGFRGAEIMDRCEELFGSWDKPQEKTDEDALFPPVPRPDAPLSKHVEIKNKKETALIIGTFGPAGNAPDLTAAKLGNSIFGEFGMMGRIGRIVREENGLAYSVSSSVDSLRKGGCWSVAAGVNPANVGKAADLIFEELRRFTREPVSAQELEDVKACYIGSMPLAFESNAGIASALHSLEFYQKGLDHFLRAADRVRAVTPETILETAKKWIDPERMVTVTAGTAGEAGD